MVVPSDCPVCAGTFHVLLGLPSPAHKLQLLAQSHCAHCWRPLLLPRAWPGPRPALLPPAQPADRTLRVAQCGHVFHGSCAGEVEGRCPLCRAHIQTLTPMHVLQEAKCICGSKESEDGAQVERPREQSPERLREEDEEEEEVNNNEAGGDDSAIPFPNRMTSTPNKNQEEHQEPEPMEEVHEESLPLDNPPAAKKPRDETPEKGPTETTLPTAPPPSPEKENPENSSEEALPTLLMSDLDAVEESVDSLQESLRAAAEALRRLLNDDDYDEEE